MINDHRCGVRATALEEEAVGGILRTPGAACNSQRCHSMAQRQSVGGEDLPRRPIKLRTVEHGSGRFPSTSRTSKTMVRSRSFPGLVVSLDRLDLQGGMQPELVDFEFVHGRSGSIVHCFMPGNRSPFFYGTGPLRFFFLGGTARRVLHWDAHG